VEIGITPSAVSGSYKYLYFKEQEFQDKFSPVVFLVIWVIFGHFGVVGTQKNSISATVTNNGH
jgi:hypothetical protein